MNLLESFKAINTFAFDLDGVLTDGTFTLLPGGVFARKMNVKDGYALQLAIKKGYRVVVISGSSSDEAVNRLKRLGINDIFMRILDKENELAEYLSQNNIQSENVLFMGDDIPDLGVMKRVGVACCPADAVEEIKSVSAYISHLNGGYGCCRDVIEKVLKLNNDWNEDLTIAST